jgi:hypothetical protein
VHSEELCSSPGLTEGQTNALSSAGFGLNDVGVLFVANHNSLRTRLVDNCDRHNKSFLFVYIFTAARSLALRARGL